MGGCKSLGNSGIGLSGDSLNEAAVIHFLSSQGQIKNEKKNSQRLITYTFNMFVERDVLGNSSKIYAGGSEFNCVSKKINSFF